MSKKSGILADRMCQQGAGFRIIRSTRFWLALFLWAYYDGDSRENVAALEAMTPSKKTVLPLLTMFFYSEYGRRGWWVSVGAGARFLEVRFHGGWCTDNGNYCSYGAV
ncbi:hypothetical protein DUZ99_16465 [Xylanibacillus composti]|nr:hypothetical protein [Xylanibacillus composti]